jgi:hypothetical protein
MDQRKTLGKLLRHVAQCIENSTADDLDDLLSGHKFLRIVSPKDHAPPNKKALGSSFTEANLPKLASKLQELSTREEGYQALEEANLTRKRLEELARLLQLPVNRGDNIGRLEEKVIESCIGSRLNSEAIQGTGSTAIR